MSVSYNDSRYSYLLCVCVSLCSGIEIKHENFGGRAIWGIDYIDNPPREDDPNGHGTHCAGTIMSNTWGLAKKGTAIAVRVLDQNGSGSFE